MQAKLFRQQQSRQQQSRQQQSGQATNQSDPLRHEWVSCVLLKAFILLEPKTWLSRLAAGDVNENALQKAPLSELSQQRLFEDLPAVAQVVMWLILSHHRLPTVNDQKHLWSQWEGPSIAYVLEQLNSEWGYKNSDDIHTCLQFKHGLLSQSATWLKYVKRCAQQLQQQDSLIQHLMDSGEIRVVLHHARLCLMLADHHYSSLDKKRSGQWTKHGHLAANTDHQGKPKQALDQHLVGVYKQAKRNVNLLPALEAMALTGANNISAKNIAALRKPSGDGFQWQDHAVNEIGIWRQKNPSKRFGFFAINMASTGCGKTFANAKVMYSLCENNLGLRYSLALGLRTLTLQTGKEYQQRIFKNRQQQDLAILIGSKAVVELHQQTPSIQKGESGSESAESLLKDSETLFTDGDGDGDGINLSALATVLKQAQQRQLLLAPVI
ncbi:MAG: hypothetical protein AAFZ92_03420 [Pseudomonadota bacterium]